MCLNGVKVKLAKVYVVLWPIETSLKLTVVIFLFGGEKMCVADVYVLDIVIS
jgi:hypothetical protein